MQEDYITAQDNSAQIINALSDIPGEITDPNDLFEVNRRRCNRQEIAWLRGLES